jgi:Tfp pilus assembly protein PilF
VWAIQEQSIGGNHPDTLASLTRIATAQEKQGNHEAAEENYTTALTGLEVAVGWSDGSTNHTASNLLQFFQNQRRFDEAEAVGQRSVAGLTEVFGATDPRTLMQQMTLAELTLERGNTEEAKKILEKVLDEMDPRHPHYMKALLMNERVLESE